MGGSARRYSGLGCNRSEGEKRGWEAWVGSVGGKRGWEAWVGSVGG